jgi:ADP-heptose:LPS heptosyltransferase
MKNFEFLDWLPLFDKDSLIVNLQYGDTSNEQQMVQSLGLEMLSFNNLNFTQDLDNWLALTAACDSVISVSTSLVHFAGACGQKVAVVMPLKQGHWTLGLNETESIFYPNVRIFRKQEDELDSSLILRASNAINTD